METNHGATLANLKISIEISQIFPKLNENLTEIATQTQNQTDVGIQTTNGIQSTNGIQKTNGIQAKNGIQTTNGIQSNFVLNSDFFLKLFQNLLKDQRFGSNRFPLLKNLAVEFFNLTSEFNPKKNFRNPRNFSGIRQFYQPTQSQHLASLTVTSRINPLGITTHSY